MCPFLIKPARRLVKVIAAVVVGIIFLTLLPATVLSLSNSLPEVLSFSDGTPVSSLTDWSPSRREEIKELFQKEMYGFFPRVPQVEYRVVKEDANVLGGKIKYREVEISFDGLEDSAMTVAVFLPNQAKSPSPLIVGIGLCGNHTVLEKNSSVPRVYPWVNAGGYFDIIDMTC